MEAWLYCWEGCHHQHRQKQQQQQQQQQQKQAGQQNNGIICIKMMIKLAATSGNDTEGDLRIYAALSM